MIPRRCVWVWMCVCVCMCVCLCVCVCVCVCVRRAGMFSFGKWGTLNRCFAPLSASICISLSVFTSACLHFPLSQTSVSLAFVPCLLYSVREQSSPHLSPLHSSPLNSICSFPISRPFCSFDCPLHFPFPTSLHHYLPFLSPLSSSSSRLISILACPCVVYLIGELFSPWKRNV